jgi:hypothetical protein
MRHDISIFPSWDRYRGVQLVGGRRLDRYRGKGFGDEGLVMVCQETEKQNNGRAPR